MKLSSLPKVSSRNNNLNFLRLLFAALVLVSHAPELRDGNRSRELLTQVFGTVSFGELAVNGFFILSGYLIVKSWQGKPNLRDFFEKRVRRIYPGFLVAFLLSVFLIAPFAAPHIGTYFTELNYKGLLVNALVLSPPVVPTIFAGTPNAIINGAMWSISYEFRCYAIVALVGLLGATWEKNIWLALMVLFLFLSMLPEQVSKIDFPGLYILLGTPVTFVRVFSSFCVGACFQLYQDYIPLKGKWAAAATIGLFGLMFYSSLVTVSLATLGAYIIFWVAFADIPALEGFKHVDDVSYGLYLYGWPVQKMLDWRFPAVSPWMLLLTALIICGLAGYASWHLVESWFLRRSRRP